MEAAGLVYTDLIKLLNYSKLDEFRPLLRILEDFWPPALSAQQEAAWRKRHVAPARARLVDDMNN